MGKGGGLVVDSSANVVTIDRDEEEPRGVGAIQEPRNAEFQNPRIQMEPQASGLPRGGVCPWTDGERAGPMVLKSCKSRRRKAASAGARA